MNTPAASSEESQVLVPSEGGHLAGMLHTPKKSVRSPAVLFCPPFGDERKAAWRAMAQLARTLAGDGWPVLRFDYRGCGESPGGFVDATLETRLADIQTAASFLQTEVGSPGICCLGLRFGATLALRAFEMLPDCQDVIFIEPVIDGGEYFDRMEQRKKLREMITKGRAADGGRPREILDLDGYAVRRATLSQMREVCFELTSGNTPDRALLIQISFNEKLRGATEKARDALKRGATNVVLKQLVMPPFWSRVDLVDTTPLDEAVTQWLRGHSGGGFRKRA